MPGPITVILESDPSPRPTPFRHSTSPPPHQAGGCAPTPARALYSELPGTRGDREASCPHSQTLLPAGEESPSSLLPGTPSAHTQLFIASGNTPTARPPPPFNRHRAPAHTHTAGAPTQEAPPPPAHSPIPAEAAVPQLAASEPRGAPPPKT